MGYTIGRRLSKDFIKKEALKYKSRSEFQKKDPSCYRTALMNGYIDYVCRHMKVKSFSIPQRICLSVFNQLLQEEGIYNSRKIIPPYEIDIYYDKKSFAVEYNGKGWHFLEEVKIRDNNKKLLLNQKNIFLITISEQSRDYESDIKTQIIEKVDEINDFLKTSFTLEDIENIKVEYSEVYNIYDFEKIKSIISKYGNIKDFRKDNPNEYYFLLRTKNLRLLDKIRIRKNITDRQLIKNAEKIASYTDLVKNKSLYLRLRKRGLLDIASKHMYRKRNTYKEDISFYASRCKNISEFKSRYSSLYKKALKQGIVRKLFKGD